MPGRRSFGTIRKLPSGRWQASYWHEGNRHTAPTTFRFKADAAAFLANAETELSRGRWVDPGAGKVTLRAYATTWLSQRSDLRETTRAKYEYLLRRHIEPSLGDMPLAGLSPSAVRNWYHALAVPHPTTADDAYRLLRAVLNTARADRLIGESPCQVRGAGQVRSAERPVASVREVQAAVSAVPDRYRLAFLLTAWCQLRRGEVLALQRQNVDLQAGTIRVERAWVVPHGGKPVLGPPKTESGLRTLALPPNVVPVIEDHLDRFVDSSPTAWLFATSSGTALSPRNLNRVWNKAREAAGRSDLHLHDLRHAGLTWAAGSGASVADLMRRAGHRSPRAALIYQHSTQDRDRAIAEALGQLANDSSPVPTRT